MTAADRPETPAADPVPVPQPPGDERCGPCMIEDHASCTKAKSGVFPFAGGFAINCCCVQSAAAPGVSQ